MVSCVVCTGYVAIKVYYYQSNIISNTLKPSPLFVTNPSNSISLSCCNKWLDMDRSNVQDKLERDYHFTPRLTAEESVTMWTDEYYCFIEKFLKLATLCRVFLSFPT